LRKIIIKHYLEEYFGIDIHMKVLDFEFGEGSRHLGVKSHFLSVTYLKRVEARKVDQGDSSSLAEPSGPTSDQMSEEDLKHISGLADIKVWKFSQQRPLEPMKHSLILLKLSITILF
jgi:hypothetical protein